jgi:hypothetical protein
MKTYYVTVVKKSVEIYRVEAKSKKAAREDWPDGDLVNVLDDDSRATAVEEKEE